MEEIIVGIVFILASIYVTGIVFDSFNFFIDEGLWYMCLFPIPFLLSGINLVKNGLKKCNMDVEVSGKFCYGKICNVEKTGLYNHYKDAEDKAQLSVEIFVNVPDTSEYKLIKTQKYGFILDYYIGKYVLCKYYENKVAIIRVVEESEIPENIINQLVEKETQDELVLDGIRYIREDLL